MNLYEIKQKYRDLLDEFEESGDVEFLQKRLAATKGNYMHKLLAIAYVIKEIENDVDSLTEHDKNTKSRRNSRKKKISSLKGLIEEGMRELNMDNIKNEFMTVYLGKNPRRTHIIDADQIPDKYKTTEITTKIDKRRIKKDLKEDKEVPGVELRQSKSVKIRN